MNTRAGDDLQLRVGLKSQSCSGTSKPAVYQPDAPKLAVVISCYNYENFVGRAIDSVLAQERNDCELVVVDDGSTDSSWEVICSFRVTAFRIENAGQCAACLFGLERTRAPFILFLDADDELEAGALDVIIDRLDPEVAKLQFALTLIDANGNAIGALSSLQSFRDRDTLIDEVLRGGVYKTPPTSGNVFRRDVCELLREAPYDRAVDGVILFAAPLMGDVVSLAQQLGKYRIHGRNKSGLGGAPDALRLERDMDRFFARMNHLRAILGRLGVNRTLVDARKAYYFLEHQLYLEIMHGRRPRPITLARLLARLAAEPVPAKTRAAMALLFLLCGILPRARARALVAYRFKIGRRSAFGFVRTIFARRAAEQSR